MQSVLRQISSQQPFLIHHRRKVIQVHDSVPGAVLLQRSIHIENPLYRPLREKVLRARRVVVNRQDRRDDGRNAMGRCELCHRGQIGYDVLIAHRTGVTGDVVRSGEDHDRLGAQFNHVLPKAHQHLRRRLAADTAIHVGAVSEIVLQLPDVGNRVTEKHDAAFRRCSFGQHIVGRTIARELPKVVREHRDPRRAIVVQSGKAGRRNSRRGYGLLSAFWFLRRCPLSGAEYRHTRDQEATQENVLHRPISDRGQSHFSSDATAYSQRVSVANSSIAGVNARRIDCITRALACDTAHGRLAATDTSGSSPDLRRAVRATCT